MSKTEKSSEIREDIESLIDQSIRNYMSFFLFGPLNNPHQSDHIPHLYAISATLSFPGLVMSSILNPQNSIYSKESLLLLMLQNHMILKGMDIPLPEEETPNNGDFSILHRFREIVRKNNATHQISAGQQLSTKLIGKWASLNDNNKSYLEAKKDLSRVISCIKNQQEESLPQSYLDAMKVRIISELNGKKSFYPNILGNDIERGLLIESYDLLSILGNNTK